MKIQIQITLDLSPLSGKSTQEKISLAGHALAKLVEQCGYFSNVDHALFVTEGQ
jgi:hypothetical protein